MISNEERLSLLELLFKETGMTLPELAKDPGLLEDLVQDVFNDLQDTKIQLRGQIAALQARNQDLEDYVQMVAHDLKEPLVVLAITSNLVSIIPDTGNEKLNEYLRQMGLTAQDMKRIINNLLLFARVSKGEVPLAPMHMERVVANVQDRLSHLIREQVWTNYLSNGLKYGGRPPSLELGASAGTENVVYFWVRDNGPGIPPEIHQRLFTSNSHLGALKDPENGLGLSIVFRLVEKLGGRVGVESSPGAGSRFFFTLPAAV